MGEKRLIVDQLRLNYSGLMNTSELYKTVLGWFYERGYDMFERRNSQIITPTGKHMELEIVPWKKNSDYAQTEIKLRWFIKDATDIEVEKEGVKLKLQQGELQLIIDAWLVTDYQDQWEKKPAMYFFRTLVDKFIFRGYTDKFESMLVSDVHHLHTRIKSLLNMYKI